MLPDIIFSFVSLVYLSLRFYSITQLRVLDNIFFTRHHVALYRTFGCHLLPILLVCLYPISSM